MKLWGKGISSDKLKNRIKNREPRLDIDFN